MKGKNSLYTPATAKNVLSVGASELSASAYFTMGSISEAFWLKAGGIENLLQIKPALFGAKFSDDKKITGLIILAQPTDGCNQLQARIPTGYGVLIDRGSCDFTMKAENAQNAGAAFMVVAQADTNPSSNYVYCTNPPCAAITMTFAASYDAYKLTIPAGMVRLQQQS